MDQGRVWLSAQLGRVRTVTGLTATVLIAVMLASDLGPLIPVPHFLHQGVNALAASALIMAVATHLDRAKGQPHHLTADGVRRRRPVVCAALELLLAGVRRAVRRRHTVAARLEPVLEAVEERVADKAVRHALYSLAVGSTTYVWLLVAQISSAGHAVPPRLHELVLCVGAAFAFAGGLVLWGIWKSAIGAAARRDGMPDPTGIARLRTTRVAYRAFTLSAVLVTALLTLDVHDAGAIAWYDHQFLLALASGPLVLGLVAHAQQRIPTLRRAWTYWWGGLGGVGLLLAGQTAGLVATGHLPLPMTWQETVCALVNSVAVAGVILRYCIWTDHTEADILLMAEAELSSALGRDIDLAALAKLAPGQIEELLSRPGDETS
ncbi:hypothetical protein Lfu02_35660 [Longispora fulva]|nr:hypothetical protein Lfu02_35660 [Longispora fulva]